MLDSPEGEFFDRHAESYHSARGGMSPFHEVTAGRIEEGLHGSVLSVGGLWNSARLSVPDYRLTVLDVSAEMLKRSAREGLELVQGDVRTTDFADGTFDHVVLPLVLHHVAGRNALTARRNVRGILVRVFRMLRPGGRVWISEFCVPRAVYAVEVALAPAVRWGLTLARIPLVVMHTSSFYESALGDAGFGEVCVEHVRPASELSRWIRPVIGLPWLRVPRWLYPVRPTLVTARRPFSSLRSG